MLPVRCHAVAPTQPPAPPLLRKKQGHKAACKLQSPASCGVDRERAAERKTGCDLSINIWPYVQVVCQKLPKLYRKRHYYMGAHLYKAPNQRNFRSGGRPWNRTRRESPRGSYSPLPHLAACRPFTSVGLDNLPASRRQWANLFAPKKVLSRPPQTKRPQPPRPQPERDNAVPARH